MPTPSPRASSHPLRPNPETVVLPALPSAETQAYVTEQLTRYWSVDAQRLSRLVRFSEKLSAAASSGAILFVAVNRENFPTLEYLARGLRTRGLRTFGVYLCSEADGSDVFDDCIWCGGSLGALAELALRAPGVPIYVQAHGRRSFLSQLIHALRPELPVFHEVYDWMDAFIDPVHEDVFVAENVFSRVEIALMRASEAYVRNCTSGFIYKDGGEPMAKLLCASSAPSVQVMPCPPESWQRAPKAPAPGAWRLAHAGQLRSEGPSRAFSDLYAVPLYEDLARQGCEIAVFPSAVPNARMEGEFFGDYRALAARNARVQFREHLSLQALIEALHGNFHYGILLYHFEPDLIVGQRHLRGALASKLFGYWAAGLPVLVSEELEYMAKLVRETGAGMVVSRNELPRLALQLDRTDYGALQSRVCAAQSQFHIERFIPRVISLLSGTRTTNDRARAPERQACSS